MNSLMCCWIEKQEDVFNVSHWPKFILFSFNVLFYKHSYFVEDNRETFKKTSGCDVHDSYAGTLQVNVNGNLSLTP